MSRQNGETNTRRGYQGNQSSDSFDSSESGDRFEEVDEEEAQRASKALPSQQQWDNSRLTNFRGGEINTSSNTKKEISILKTATQQQDKADIQKLKDDYMLEYELKKQNTGAAQVKSPAKKARPNDNAHIAEQRNQLLSQLGYNGYMNIIQKNPKSNTFEVPDEYSQALNQLEQIELYGRDYIIVTVIYLSQPSNKILLSEVLGDEKVGFDRITTSRKKFFEWGDAICQGKIFPNESRDSDILLIEFLTTKVSQSQAKHIVSVLSSLSSKVFIHSGDEDLVSALNALVPLMTSIKDIFDFSSLKAYKEEDITDIVSDITPKLTIFSTNGKLLKLTQEKKSPTDLFEHALGKINDEEMKIQFMVMYKSRDLHIEGSQDAYSIKQKILFETMPKEFFGKKVKTTPAIALSFIAKVLQQKNKIKFQEELNEAFQQKIDLINQLAMKTFKDQVQSIKGFPREAEELTLHLLDLKNDALQKLNTCKHFALTNESLKKIEEKRKNFENSTFQSAIRQCLDHNMKSSAKNSEKILVKLFETIKKTMGADREGYSLKNLQTMEFDIQHFISKYCDTTGLGPAQTAALLDFLDQNLILIYKHLIQKEVDGQMKRLQNEEKELTEMQEQIVQLEKQFDDKKRRVQANKDKIDDLQGQVHQQKREVEHMESKFQNYENDTKQQKEQIKDLEVKNRQLKQDAREMEDEAKKKREERIKKLKEEQAKKGIKNKGENTEKCKCHIY